MTQELKPCPFCGGEVSASMIASAPGWFHMTVKHSDCFYKPEQEVLLLNAQELSGWNQRQQVARTPLSDEQIEDLPVWKHFVGMLPAHWIEIARAIEAAHGVTQEKQG